MADGRRIEGPEPTLPPPPGQIPGIEEMGDGHYIDPFYIRWQIENGYNPHLERYPKSTNKLFAQEQKRLR